METLNPELFPDLIATGRQAVADIEAQITTPLGDDSQSIEPAPGAETGLLGKLNTLLSRHQRIIAKEEADFQQTAADLDAQIIEIRAQQAAATKA